VIFKKHRHLQISATIYLDFKWACGLSITCLWNPDSSTAFLGLKPVISWFGRLKLAKRAMCQRHCRRKEMCQHQKGKSLRTGNNRQGVQSVQNTIIVKEMWSRFVLPLDVLQRRDKTDVLITPSHCRSASSLPDTCWRPLVSCVQIARNAPSSLHIWISMYMELFSNIRGAVTVRLTTGAATWAPSVEVDRVCC